MAKKFVDIIVGARDKSKAGFRSVEGRLNRLNKKIFSLRNLAIGGIGAAAFVQFGRSAVEAAKIAEETESKFKAVFKEEASDADEWAKAFGEAVGRADTDLKGFLATIQDTFVPLGFARDEARKMSQQVVQLAVDLASFNPGTRDVDALIALQAALTGSAETMKKFGVMINQAKINQELLRLGFKETTDGATDQQKAIATLNLILVGTADAQGDAARTADQFGNRMKRLNAELTKAKEKIGRALIPTVTQLAGVISGMAENLKNVTEEEIEDFIDGLKKAVVVVGSLVVAEKGINILASTFIVLAGAVKIATVAIGAMGVALTIATGGLTLLAGGLAAAIVWIESTDAALEGASKKAGIFNARLKDIAAESRKLGEEGVALRVEDPQTAQKRIEIFRKQIALQEKSVAVLKKQLRLQDSAVRGPARALKQEIEAAKARIQNFKKDIKFFRAIVDQQPKAVGETAKSQRKRKRRLKAISALEVKITREIEQLKIDAAKEGTAKQLALLKLRHKHEVEDGKKAGVSLVLIRQKQILQAAAEQRNRRLLEVGTIREIEQLKIEAAKKGTAKQLALLKLRHKHEVEEAKKAGVSLVLIRQKQILQVAAEQRNRRLLEVEMIREIERLKIEAAKKGLAKQLALLKLRHKNEIEDAKRAGISLVLIRQKQALQEEVLTKQVPGPRRAATLETRLLQSPGRSGRNELLAQARKAGRQAKKDRREQNNLARGSLNELRGLVALIQQQRIAFVGIN